jgi:hypothetical protein
MNNEGHAKDYDPRIVQTVRNLKIASRQSDEARSSSGKSDNRMTNSSDKSSNNIDNKYFLNFITTLVSLKAQTVTQMRTIRPV